MGNLNVILELTRGDLWVGRAENGTRFAGRNVFDVARLVYAAGFTPLIQIHRNCCS